MAIDVIEYLEQEIAKVKADTEVWEKERERAYEELARLKHEQANLEANLKYFRGAASDDTEEELLREIARGQRP